MRQKSKVKKTDSKKNKIKAKFVVVTGGVLSGLGKGITTASIGCLLQSCGYSVTACKIDPYVNFDAGTMRPTEHGEVWVTRDGGEIDEDFGHYERFLNKCIKKSQNITTGQVYHAVIEKERKGEYLGKTVQVIPHVTDEIKRRIYQIANENSVDIILIEVGGTVGDYENVLFLEAVRQMRRELGKGSMAFVHVSYLPILDSVGEMKTKPTQQSIKELRELGIRADFIVGRSSEFIDEVRKEKLSLFCDIKKEDVISNPDSASTYKLPILFEEQGFTKRLLKKLRLKQKKCNLKEWKRRIKNIEKPDKEVNIALIGKYLDIGDFKLEDSYISVGEALKHAGAELKIRVNIEWMDSKLFENGGKKLEILRGFDGVVVPGGFGSSGVEGKIAAIKYARENKIPFLGLCFGLQLAVVEFARNVCNLKGAHSTEINPKTKYPVIDTLPEQKTILANGRYGASMRLGSWEAKLKKNSLVSKLYGALEASERHRHRYEVNPKYHKVLEKNGLVFSGFSKRRKHLVEFIELKNHPFFVATQAHPEFESRFMRPSPLFVGLVRAAGKV